MDSRLVCADGSALCQQSLRYIVRCRLCVSILFCALQLEDDNATAAAPAYTQTWFWRLAVPAGFTVMCLAAGIWYAVIWSQQVYICSHLSVLPYKHVT